MTKLFFQAGGSLGYNWPSYIRRKADTDLYNNITQGYFCYVLTARQMGKSSLKVRTMNQLADEGWATASVDLTAFGTIGFTTEQWYQSFLSEIADSLSLDTVFEDWWERKKGLTPVARMAVFWEEIVLREIDSQIVLFIDEIDTMLSLDKEQFSTDDFFAAIRATYNKRSRNFIFKRLNFVILGVATPKDLMSDHERTPFNIGLAIPVKNFTQVETLGLQDGFKEIQITNQSILKRIHYWTNGQPYLTQELGQKLSQIQLESKKLHEEIDALVKQTYFQTNVFNTPHFSNIQSRILSNDDYNLHMLEIYKEILESGPCSYERVGNELLYLKLSGLVQEQGGKLIVNNRIYSHIFNKDWLHKAYEALQRPFTLDLQRWLSTKRSPDLLLKGKLLEQAEEWASTRKDLTNAERDFLQTSLLAEIKAKQDRRIQLERDKQRRRLQLALGIMILTAVVATTMGIYGFKQAAVANEKSKLAQSETKRAEAEALKAEIALRQFKQEQADRVSREVDDIILRAKRLRENGYQNAIVWRTLLEDAKQILSNYTDNELLKGKMAEVALLLQ